MKTIRFRFLLLTGLMCPYNSNASSWSLSCTSNSSHTDLILYIFLQRRQICGRALRIVNDLCLFLSVPAFHCLVIHNVMCNDSILIHCRYRIPTHPDTLCSCWFTPDVLWWLCRFWKERNTILLAIFLTIVTVYLG